MNQATASHDSAAAAAPYAMGQPASAPVRTGSLNSSAGKHDSRPAIGASYPRLKVPNKDSATQVSGRISGPKIAGAVGGVRYTGSTADRAAATIR